MSEQTPDLVVTQDGDATIIVLPPGQAAVYADEQNEQVVTGVLVVEATPGPRGLQGPPGPTGEQGPVGRTGDPGQPGPQGVRGERGLMGATGKQGKPGPPGIRGEQGKPGPQGRTGETGRTGERGPQGIPGKQGETGARGLPGMDGRDGVGIQGEDGLSAFEVAKRRGFRGTEAEWIASLRGPQGKAGERGLRGEKGEKGDVGPQGADGKLGPRGPAGGEGRFGQPGGPGPAGPAGPAGVGVPPGGSTGQVLAKLDNGDYDTVWVNQSGSGGSKFIYTQPTPLATWIVPHNLNSYVNVTILNAANTIVETDVVETDLNTATIMFSLPQSGIAIIS